MSEEYDNDEVGDEVAEGETRNEVVDDDARAYASTQEPATLTVGQSRRIIQAGRVDAASSVAESLRAHVGFERIDIAAPPSWTPNAISGEEIGGFLCPDEIAKQGGAVEVIRGDKVLENLPYLKKAPLKVADYCRIFDKVLVAGLGTEPQQAVRLIGATVLYPGVCANEDSPISLTQSGDALPALGAPKVDTPGQLAIVAWTVRDPKKPASGADILPHTHMFVSVRKVVITIGDLIGRLGDILNTLEKTIVPRVKTAANPVELEVVTRATSTLSTLISLIRANTFCFDGAGTEPLPKRCAESAHLLRRVVTYMYEPVPFGADPMPLLRPPQGDKAARDAHAARLWVAPTPTHAIGIRLKTAGDDTVGAPAISTLVMLRHVPISPVIGTWNVTHPTKLGVALNTLPTVKVVGTPETDQKTIVERYNLALGVLAPPEEAPAKAAAPPPKAAAAAAPEKKPPTTVIPAPTASAVAAMTPASTEAALQLLNTVAKATATEVLEPPAKQKTTRAPTTGDKRKGDEVGAAAKKAKTEPEPENQEITQEPASDDVETKKAPAKKAEPAAKEMPPKKADATPASTATKATDAKKPDATPAAAAKKPEPTKKAETPKVDASKTAAPKTETPKTDAPKAEPPKPDDAKGTKRKADAMATTEPALSADGMSTADGWYNMPVADMAGNDMALHTTHGRIAARFESSARSRFGSGKNGFGPLGQLMATDDKMTAAQRLQICGAVQLLAMFGVVEDVVKLIKDKAAQTEAEEAARIAEQLAAEEAARAEEARKAEEERLAEEARLSEEKRAADEAKQADSEAQAAEDAARKAKKEKKAAMAAAIAAAEAEAAALAAAARIAKMKADAAEMSEDE